jgi:putative membrane protein
VSLAQRSWARTVWIACPDAIDSPNSADPDERRKDTVRAVIEKKSVINLVEAFGVSLKHYLRGEEGVFYEDLWHLVRRTLLRSLIGPTLFLM